MLQFRSVSRIYPDGTKAADGISLTIQRGEFCVLLGPSGAGKSTLMGMVNGLVEPSAGEVLFDGEAVTRRSMKKFQQRVGTIHQQLHLVPRLSVLHNVLAGKLPAVSAWRALLKWFAEVDQRRACRLLEEVELQEKHIYRRASELSGGQQQRVAIARAFMPEPEVVLADEPVASLDPSISRSVLHSLKRASRIHDATVLCSLHQVEYAVEFADRIIALREGRVVYDGSPVGLSDEVLSRIYDQGAPLRNGAEAETAAEQGVPQAAWA